MKIYRYWAKAAAGERSQGTHAECFGCSNDSVEAALADAQSRASKLAEAIGRADPNKRYLYSDRPVREEILQEFEHDGRPTAAITRNGYGSLVLNTSNVFLPTLTTKMKRRQSSQ